VVDGPLGSYRRRRFDVRLIGCLIATDTANWLRKLSRSLRAVSEALLRGILDHLGVCGRFRYSDLKEAPGYGV
jgi:hypothetical protein